MNIPLVSFKDIVTFRGGGTPPKKIAEYWNGDIPWATVKDFKGLKLSETKDCISTKGLHKSSANLILKGHVIIPTRMALGKAAINTIDLAINQDLRALIPKIKIHTGYLLYAYLSLSDEIEKRGSGATVKGITQDNLYKLKIPLPTLNDQIRTATLLSRVEALIATRKDNLRLLDQFLKSTFLEMFGDPVRNEKGWNRKPIKKIADVKIGPFGSLLHAKDYVANGVPIVNPSHIVEGKIVPDNEKSLSQKKYLELNTYHLKKNDVVVARRGEIGRCAIVMNDEPLFCGTGSMFVRIQNDYSPNLLQFQIYKTSLRSYLEGKAKGVTMKNLNSKILGNVEVLNPPMKFQCQFATIVKKVDSIKTLYQQNLNELENLYGALSQKAFKGELDLSRIPLKNNITENEREY